MISCAPDHNCLSYLCNSGNGDSPNNANLSKNWTEIGASSYHPGGVNTGFLDGSVRFVKNSINPQSWWALSTKAGGEVISADSY